MFNLQGTLLVMSSWPPLPTSPPPCSHPWLTMGGSNRAVTVPKCLSRSGLPCGEQFFLIHLLFPLVGWEAVPTVLGIGSECGGDAGWLPSGKDYLHGQLMPPWSQKATDACGCQSQIKTGVCVQYR